MRTRHTFDPRLLALGAVTLFALSSTALGASDPVVKRSVDVSATKPAIVSLVTGDGVSVKVGLSVKAGGELGGMRRGLVVERLWINKGSKALEAPLSAYADIYDPHVLTVSARAKSTEIEIDGSDGADGYRVVLSVDDRGVVSRTLFIVGDQVAEHTTYHRVVVD